MWDESLVRTNWITVGSAIKAYKRDENLKSTMSIMDIVAGDGKSREMICLPLNMINGWLFGIDANRVKPEIKENVLAYQRECYAVLYDYWHGNGAFGALKPADEIRYLNQRLQLLDKLYKTRDNTHRVQLYEQLEKVNAVLDFKTPTLEAFTPTDGNAGLDDATRETLAEFWQAVDTLISIDIPLDHHYNPRIRALNLNEVLRHAEESGVLIPTRAELLRVLPQCCEPQFLGASVSVSSVIAKNKQGKPKTQRCWLFRYGC